MTRLKDAVGDGMKANAKNWNSYYSAPIVEHDGLSGMDLSGPRTAIRSVRLSEGRSFDFFSKLLLADTLYVSLHGAVPASAPRHPHFRRVESMRDRVQAVICLADPTLQLDLAENFRLGWYVGSEDWDPLLELAELCRQAMVHVGAKRVMFLGSSGGGFAALRLAPLFPGSMAFVQDPQTRIAKYYEGHRKRLFAANWPTTSEEDAIHAEPGRFDMLRLYRSTDTENFVYYRQATSDVMHMTDHAFPFMHAVSSLNASISGRHRFVFEKGARPGHGAITPQEFDRHFLESMQFWGSAETDVAGLLPFA